MPKKAKSKSKSGSKSSSNYDRLDSRSNSSSSKKIIKSPKKGKSVSKRSKFLTSSRNSRSLSRKSRTATGKYSSSRSVSEDKQVPLLKKRVEDIKSKMRKIRVFRVGNVEMPEDSEFMQSFDELQSVNKEFKKLQARDSFLTSAVNAHESPNIIVKTIVFTRG